MVLSSVMEEVTAYVYSATTYSDFVEGQHQLEPCRVGVRRQQFEDVPQRSADEKWCCIW